MLQGASWRLELNVHDSVLSSRVYFFSYIGLLVLRCLDPFKLADDGNSKARLGADKKGPLTTQAVAHHAIHGYNTANSRTRDLGSLHIVIILGRYHTENAQ